MKSDAAALMLESLLLSYCMRQAFLPLWLLYLLLLLHFTGIIPWWISATGKVMTICLCHTNYTNNPSYDFKDKYTD